MVRGMAVQWAQARSLGSAFGSPGSLATADAKAENTNTGTLPRQDRFQQEALDRARRLGARILRN